MVTAPVAALLGCPAWMASVSKRYMFPLLPHELRRTLTLLTCRGEKLQEGPGSRRQSVYASAPGRGINIRRVVWRDMRRESNFVLVRCQQGDGSRGVRGEAEKNRENRFSPPLRVLRVNRSLNLSRDAVAIRAE